LYAGAVDDGAADEPALDFGAALVLGGEAGLARDVGSTALGATGSLALGAAEVAGAETAAATLTVGAGAVVAGTLDGPFLLTTATAVAGERGARRCIITTVTAAATTADASATTALRRACTDEARPTVKGTESADALDPEASGLTIVGKSVL